MSDKKVMKSNNKNDSKVYGNESPLESLKKSFLEPDVADVYFNIRPYEYSGERVPAHKVLLALDSDVFKKFFFGNSTSTGDVNLDDVTAGAFKEFLQFFYLDEVKLTKENIAQVLSLGDQYNVTKCVNICKQFLEDNLTIDFACSVLHLAIFYNYEELLKDCEAYIAINTSEVLKSADFMICNKRVLKHILEMDFLSSTEVEIFEACMSWVKFKSKQDVLTNEIVHTHLNNLFYEIRFNSMTAEEFNILDDAYGDVLTPNYKNIMKMILQPGYQVKEFNQKLRENFIIECDRVINNIEYIQDYTVYNGEETLFSTNQPLELIGFTCQQVVSKGTNDLTSQLSVNVHISKVEDADEWELLNGEMYLNMYRTEASLSKPVSIEPEKLYKISITNFPSDKYAHLSKNLKSEVKINSDISITFHNDCDYNERRVNLISALKFTRSKTN